VALPTKEVHRGYHWLNRSMRVNANASITAMTAGAPIACVIGCRQLHAAKAPAYSCSSNNAAVGPPVMKLLLPSVPAKWA
jgi:hypothetical protein